MASSDIQFKITGAENLRKRLKANNLLMTPLRNYFNASGKIIKEKSKGHAPVDTGALKRSIKYTKKGIQKTKSKIIKKAIVQLSEGDSIDFYNNL